LVQEALEVGRQRLVLLAELPVLALMEHSYTQAVVVLATTVLQIRREALEVLLSVPAMDRESMAMLAMRSRRALPIGQARLMAEQDILPEAAITAIWDILPIGVVVVAVALALLLPMRI